MINSNDSCDIHCTSSHQMQVLVCLVFKQKEKLSNLVLIGGGLCIFFFKFLCCLLFGCSMALIKLPTIIKSYIIIYTVYPMLLNFFLEPIQINDLYWRRFEIKNLFPYKTDILKFEIFDQKYKQICLFYINLIVIRFSSD